MWRTERYKLVRQAPGERERLFDLEADPRETRDIRADEPQLAAELGAQLEAFFARYEQPARSGLLAPQGPRHNFNEAWREPLVPHGATRANSG